MVIHHAPPEVIHHAPPEVIHHEEPPGVRRRRGRGLAVALSVVALLVLALGIGAWALSGTREGVVPRGTTVLGTDLGGLRRDEAVSRLEAAAADRARQPLVLQAAGTSARLTPAELGLALDARATVDAARDTGRMDALRRLLPGDTPTAPVMRVDEARMRSALGPLAERVDRPLREGDVRFTGLQPEAVEPRAGRQLDRDAAAQRIRDGYLTGSGPVELPVRTLEPAVNAAEVQRAVREVAAPAVAAPVTVSVADQRRTLAPAVLARALDFRPAAGRLEPVLDGERLQDALTAAGPLAQAPKDATWRIVQGKPVVVPGQRGGGVEPSALSAAVLPVLSQTGGRAVAVPLSGKDPERTTEEAQALGITQRLSTFTQEFPARPAGRHQNISTAARYLNGTLVAPGQVFSMNDTVKERTPENGYAIATVLANGRHAKGYGGGVSSITTAVWDVAFFAGMDRVEQHPHSVWISRYKPGLEATVAWGQKDLKWRNPAPTGVLMTTSTTPTSVTITVWGTRQYDDIDAVFGPRRNVTPPPRIVDRGPDCDEVNGEEGFSIDVDRVFEQGGREVKRETFTTRYNPDPDVRCA